VPKRTRPYRARLLERLTRPEDAANYLNAAMGDSRETFLTALKDVAQAHQMARVAKESGLQRETLYRSFSNEGNPTLDTLLSVLSVFKIKTRFAAEGAEFVAPPSVVPQARSGVAPRTKRIRHLTELRNAGQLELAFPQSINAGSGLLSKIGSSTVGIAHARFAANSATNVPYGVHHYGIRDDESVDSLNQGSGSLSRFFIPPQNPTGFGIVSRP
jgi:probable addiction module antidote protein